MVRVNLQKFPLLVDVNWQLLTEAKKAICFSKSHLATGLNTAQPGKARKQDQDSVECDGDFPLQRLYPSTPISHNVIQNKFLQFYFKNSGNLPLSHLSARDLLSHLQ